MSQSHSSNATGRKDVTYYDAQEKRLVYVGQPASSEFWDKKWKALDIRSQVLSAKNRLVVSITRRFLLAGSKILEGGCGIGDKVYSLIAAGFDAVGVDFAKEVVAKINDALPELPAFAQDVTRLEFENASFDGYWSIGVIEHFKHGYDLAASEMARVLKPGGVLFVSFPWFSPLRALKAALGFYPTFPKDSKLPNNFYQFALNARRVERHFAQKNFLLLHRRAYDAVLGLASELGPLKPLFLWIYKQQGFVWRALRKIMDIIFGALCGHSIILVLRKR